MRMKRRPSRARRGVTAMIALVALTVLGLIGGVLIRQSVMRDRRARDDERQVQADWLVQAGLERAWAGLRAEGGYAGEDWRIKPADLGGSPGRVEIKVEPGAGGGREVRVSAEYPSGDPAASRSSGTFQVEIGTNEAGGGP